MADDNIFQQYLRPPKSVMEYTADYDLADSRKQNLQLNALQLAAGQQKYDEGAQASARAAQLRATLMGLPQGATDDQRIQAMRSTASPEGYAAADTLDKSLIERRKSTAAAAKDDATTANSTFELRVKKSDQAIKDMASFATPQEAIADLQRHAAAGHIPADQAQMILKGIPQDPAQFPAWQIKMLKNIMNAKEQMTLQLDQTKQAEQVRQFGVTDKRIQSEGAAGRATQIQVQNMIGARQDKKDVDDGTGLSDATKLRIAKQFVDAGDASGMKNVGRGGQGAKDLRSIQNAITDYATEKGMSPSQISAKMADFDGLKAGIRTSANISARVENAISEARELIPLALEASKKVSRPGFLPFGNAKVLFDINTNDKAMNSFATRNLGLATAYAGAMARGGKATVDDKHHAMDLISGAKDQGAYETVINDLVLEMEAASRAPEKVREHLKGQIDGSGKKAAPSAVPPAKLSLSDIFGK